jgi:hypothetical protein
MPRKAPRYASPGVFQGLTVFFSMRPDDIHPYLLPIPHQSHSDSNSARSVPRLWDFADGMAHRHPIHMIGRKFPKAKLKVKSILFKNLNARQDKHL